MGVLGTVGASVGGWIVFSIAAALGVGRAISLADRHGRPLNVIVGGNEEHSPVRRIETLNSAQIPKISVK